MDNLIDMVDKVLEESLRPSEWSHLDGIWRNRRIAPIKPFPPTPRKVVTVTIEESGNAVFLATDSADVFLEMGTVVTRRASHIEPATFWARQAFRVLRTLFSDTSAVAAWTRTWHCFWRVNTKPIGGPILRNQYGNIAAWWLRQDAVDAEVKFLNSWFAERGI